MANLDVSTVQYNTIVLDDPDGTYLTVDSTGSIVASSGVGVLSSGTDPSNNSLDNSGAITGGAGTFGVDFSAGGSFNNFDGATITGGFDAAGVSFGGSGNFTNQGAIQGGDAASGSSGGAGAIIDAYGQNAGSITGGGGATGGAGMSLAASFSNNSLGTIIGGTGTDVGGAGVVLTSASAFLLNDGQVTGGHGGTAGGVGVVGISGAYIYNYGNITGGDGGASGGSGVVINGANFINYGTITGGDGTPGDAIDFGTGAGSFTEESAATLGGAIGGFNSGDTLEFMGSGGVSSFDSATDTLTLNDGTTVGFTAFGTNLQFSTDASGDLMVSAACYAKGTLIPTPTGEVPIESLGIGSPILTAVGEVHTVRWTGRRRIDCARHPRPAEVWPVCVSAHALGENIPSRDLWVSPGHSLYLDGHLIPAGLLVNGVTVRQVAQKSVEYWHVELDRHDIILANQLPAESYLDTGNRMAFENGGEYLELHPNFRAKHWTDTCVPLATEGSIVHQVKRQLLSRLETRGHRITDHSDVHIDVDGQRVAPVWLDDKRLAFLLAAGGNRINLCSHTFVPAEVVAESDDRRALGVSVVRLQIDGHDINLGGLHEGWHPLEANADVRWRWTTGRVPLPANTRLVLLDLGGRGYYRAGPVEKSGAAPASRALDATPNKGALSPLLNLERRVNPWAAA
jgi:hypothetical protein